MMNITRVAVAIVLSGSAAGCYATRDAIDDVVISAMNRMYASAAWAEWKPDDDALEYRRHFEDGFKAGYISVASGGIGTPPTLPPRKYWTAPYQNPIGHQKRLSWYNGYSQGALAAEQDGIAGWDRIAVHGVWSMDRPGVTSIDAEQTDVTQSVRNSQ